MTRKQEPQEYQSYKRYKKNKDVTAQNILTVFTTTFLIMLVFFIGAARRITPNVDVSIGEDSTVDAKESGLGVKGFIDNRLRAIQSEDTNIMAKKVEEARNKFEEDDEDEYFDKTLEEKVKIPVKKVKQEVKQVTQEVQQTHEHKTATTTPPKPVEIPTAYNPVIKVVVGSYSSIDQAKVAQSILQEAGLGVTPFVKNIQGTYTLQVGSFSSEAKAQSLANELLKHNYPARIIK